MCGASTAHGKPYCGAHVECMPYAREILVELARQERVAAQRRARKAEAAERAKSARRVKHTRLAEHRAEALERGQHVSRTPFGYRREDGRLVPHPEEAPVVCAAFRVYLRARSLVGACAALAVEHPGRAWSQSGLAWIVTNPTYVGRVRFGAKSRPGVHEPIVAPIVYHKAQKLLAENRARRTGGRRPLVLAGEEVVPCG